MPPAKTLSSWTRSTIALVRNSFDALAGVIRRRARSSAVACQLLPLLDVQVAGAGRSRRTGSRASVVAGLERAQRLRPSARTNSPPHADQVDLARQATLPSSARSYSQVISPCSVRSCQPSDVADEAGRTLQPGRGAAQRQRRAPSRCGEEHRLALCVADPGGVARALVAQVRREQHVEVIVVQLALQRREARALQDDVSLRIGQDLLLDPVAAFRVGVGEAVERDAGVGVR